MIFTLLICCFLGLGALQPSCAAPRTYENNIVESKQRNNMYSNNGYYYFGYGDLASENFILGVINYVTTNADGDNYPYWIVPNDTRTGSMSISLNVVDANYNNSISTYYKYTGSDGTYNNAGVLNSLNINKSISGYNHLYHIILYNDINALVFECYYAFFYTPNMLSTNRYTFAIAGPTSVYSSNFTVIAKETSFATSPFVVFYKNTPLYLAQHKYTSGSAYENGYSVGYSEGLDEGTSTGYNKGYAEGEEVGYESGYGIGYEGGYMDGRQTGYVEGYDEASNQDTVAAQIFTGFVEVGLLPVNVFLQMFEYEVFGINIAGLVSGLLTIAIVIIIIRVITGKKNG